MTTGKALAIAYAHAQLVQAMQFERFADHSKVPEHIQMMEYMLEKYRVALEYYTEARGVPQENVQE